VTGCGRSRPHVHSLRFCAESDRHGCLYASRKRVARRSRHKIKMPARSRLVQIVLTTSPRFKPRRLARKSPSVVTAVRAATMVSQYQDFVILPCWSETNQMTIRTATSTTDHREVGQGDPGGQHQAGLRAGSPRPRSVISVLQIRSADRCGSDWDIRRCLLYVRFAPESGHGRMRAQFIRPPRPADSRLFAQKS
jgi:hypothetical protein